VSYTVRWEPDARHELHLIWATAPDPASVRSASETAERALAADPYDAGQHLVEELWRAAFHPLVVYYSVDPAQQIVVISNVAHTA
jgi:hypothetical protein